MNRSVLIIATLFVTTLANAQQSSTSKPDTSSEYYKIVQTLTALSSDPESSMYYPKLALIFCHFDSSVNEKYLPIMLYGFKRTAAYGNKAALLDSLNIIKQLNNDQKYREAEIIARKLFLSYPFSCQLIELLLNIYNNLDNQQMITKCNAKFAQLMLAFSKSGDGTLEFPRLQLFENDLSYYFKYYRCTIIEDDKLVDLVNDINDPIKINSVRYKDMQGVDREMFFNVTDLFTRNFVYEIQKQMKKKEN